MKRFLSILLVFCLFITFLPARTVTAGGAVSSVPMLSTPVYTSDDMADLSAVPEFEYEFLPAGEKWINMAANDEPATFKDVSYELADGVVVLQTTVSDKIASAGQLISGSAVQLKPPEKIIRDGGYIDRGILDQVLSYSGGTADPGTVVIDPQAGTSFKISASTAFPTDYGEASLDKQAEALENTYMIEQPRINEVFSDFSIGGKDGEKVGLTRGNITGFAENVEACVVPDGAVKTMSFGDALKDYKYLTGDKLINLQFTDTKLTAGGSGGKQLTVTLSGGLGISDIEVDAKYSAFGGYHMIMNVAEEFYLVAEVQGTIQEEVRIPLLGIDIPFGIGRVSGGLFLILGVDGDIRIEAEAREYTSARMGVRGKTYFGLPVSAKGVFNKEFLKDGDVDIAGKIDGYVKVGPLLEISLFGLDLVGAGAFVGVGLRVEKDGGKSAENNGQMLDINLYASLQIYIKIIGKTLNLINWTPSLLHKRQQDTGGYRVHIEEAYIEIGRVGGYIEDTRSSSDEGVRVPPGINYRILVYPSGVDPQTAAESDLRIYPKSGWQQTSNEGEFFFEEPVTMLKKGDRVAVQFMIGNEVFRSDPVEALFPYDTVTISEADYFNDFVTGSVAPIKVIDYAAQQVAKPGDPADPPEMQYKLDYYTGPIFIQGLCGRMMSVNAHNPLNQELMHSEVYMPFGQGGIVTVMTDERGNFDSRNPQMLPDGEYAPVFNGELQIRPGATVLGNGKFDYSKNKNISAVKVSFDLSLFDYTDEPAGYTNSHTILINPTHPLTVSRTISFVEGSYKRYNDGDKIVDRMQFNETVNIINSGGTRAVTNQEVLAFFEEGWTTQDIAEYADGRFWGSEGDAPVLSQAVSGGNFTVSTVLDDNGDPTSSVSVSNRVIVEWVWQEHPLPTEITSENHAAVIAGDSFQAAGKGIWPLVWSLSDAPEGITIDPATGRISVSDSVNAQDYTFKVRLEQDPKYFKTELLRTQPMSNASYVFGFNKSSLQAIADFYRDNKANPAMKGDPPVNYIGHYPAPAAEQLFTLTVTEPAQTPAPMRTAPDIASAYHGYRFTLTPGIEDLSVLITASGSAPVVWSLAPAGDRRIPAEIGIDAATGELTILKSIPEGVYYFTIRAENDVGSDTQDCVVTVTDTRTAPIISEEEHGYIFTKLVGGGDLTVPVTASGSTPVFWHLEQIGERYIIPDEVAIDINTGILTVKEGIEPGTYYFVIYAENDAGVDTQECTLKVVSSLFPYSPMRPRISMPSDDAGRVILLDASSGSGVPPITQTLPANSTTIRVDHIRDRYTYDRFHVNGAEFIRWNSVFKLNIEGSPEEVVFSANAKMCDSYHIYIDMSDPELLNIVTDMGKRLQNIEDAKDNLGEYLQNEVDQYVTDPWNDESLRLNGMPAEFAPFDLNGHSLLTESTLLDYGVTVNAVLSSKGGTHSVQLGGTNGTSVTGAFFSALAQAPSAVLEFRQEGANITFFGSDVGNVAEGLMYDFGFVPMAEHEEQMRAALPDGQSAFFYSFIGHGELPGVATFSVTTDIAEGTKVNVYKFDAATGGFSLIAGDIAVGAGSVVTYKNDTLSEYLITTNTIDGAQVSDMVGRQGGENNVFRPVFAIIGIAAVCSALAVWVFLRRRKRAGSVQ